MNMCQMASARVRATSTWATSLLAEAPLDGLVVGPVGGMTSRGGGRLDQRPAQLGRTVLGERAAVILARRLALE